jgi:hypothetical protein
MFMENILDSDFQFVSSTSELFDDVSIVITGLLDVVQRSTRELSLQDEKSDQDPTALNEALRKALIVAELLLREKKNRQRIVDPMDLIR